MWSWKQASLVVQEPPCFYSPEKWFLIGFIAPVIGPSKSKKLTQLIAPAHNIRGKVWMKNNIHGFTDKQTQTVIGYKAMYVVFHSNFAAYIVCRRYKPCEFLGFVWTDCWGNKSYYVITSPASSISGDVQLFFIIIFP